MWTKRDIGGVPKRFAGQVPLYQVIESYVLEQDEEILTVDRAFSNCQEYTSVSYEGPKVKEQVKILEGNIVFVTSHLVIDTSNFLNLRVVDTLVGRVRFQLLFTPPKTRFPQYLNIKRYERELQLLPWQKDLEAIYQGSGVIRNLLS